VNSREALYILSRLAALRHVVQSLLARQALAQPDPQAWLAAERGRLSRLFDSITMPNDDPARLELVIGEMEDAVKEIIAGAEKIAADAMPPWPAGGEGG
jgi:hypothetical protein